MQKNMFAIMIRVFIFIWLLVTSGTCLSRDDAEDTEANYLNALQKFSRRGMNNSLELSPDGSAIAYVTEADQWQKGDFALTWVKILSTGKTVQLPGKATNSGPRADGGTAVRPRWSPDGLRLAYFASDGDKFYLRIWRRDTGHETVFRSRRACAMALPCNFYDLQWSPDSKTVYYLSESNEALAAAPDSYKDGGAPREARLQLMYEDPEHGGVTVRASPAVLAGDDQHRDIIGTLVDVVAANVARVDVATILAGTAARRLYTSPDGKKLLISVELENDPNVRQAYSDYYVVPLPERLSEVSMNAVTPPSCGARDWQGENVQPAIHKVKQWIGQASWSPTSDRIAFAEHGALTDGDMMILDVATNKVRNLTGSLKLPVQNIAPGASDPSNIDSRSFDYSVKFGEMYYPPVWSRDGKTLYARREHSYGGGPKELWAISALTGTAQNLTPDSEFDVTNILHRDGVAIEGRTAETVMSAVKFQDSLESGFIEAALDSSRPTVRARMKGTAADNRVYISPSVRAPFVAFVNENTTTPQEAHVLNLQTGAIIQITDINQAAARSNVPRRHRISWATPDGDIQQGFLYLPPIISAEHSFEPLPIIVQVYPGQLYTKTNDNVYLGRTRIFFPPLTQMLESGYAILTPDLVVKGDGKTCVDVGANVVAALDAAGKTGLVDTDRAAVFGHSFGGWAVNCIVTRTTRFKAAVSSAGASNLTSLKFSVNEGARNWSHGGGQTKIGKSLDEAPELYWAESPIFHLESVTTPLLLVHGKMDDVVSFEESVKMFVGLSTLGRTVTLIGYDGEGHATYFRNPDYAGRVVNWLERYIGPTANAKQPSY